MKKLFLIISLVIPFSYLVHCQSFSSSYAEPRICDNFIGSLDILAFSIDNQLNRRTDFFAANLGGIQYTVGSWFNYQSTLASDSGRYNYQTVAMLGYNHRLFKRYEKISPYIGMDLHLLTTNMRDRDPDKLINLDQPWFDLKSSLLYSPLSWLEVSLTAGYRRNFTSKTALVFEGPYASASLKIGFNSYESCKTRARNSRIAINKELKNSSSLDGLELVDLEDYYQNSKKNSKYITEVRDELISRYWDKVEEIDKREVYEDFLSDIPEESVYAKLAAEIVAGYVWRDIKRDPDLEDIKKFLLDYDTKYTAEAMEYHHWYAVKKYDVDAVREFINAHQDSRFRNEAIDLLAKLEYNTATRINTMEVYEDYIKKYPDTPYAEEARNIVSLDRFKDVRHINTMQSYQAFLSSEMLSDSVRILALDAMEDLMIDEVVKNGAGKRFTIQSIVPVPGKTSGAIAMKQMEGTTDFFFLTTYYPKDQLMYILNVNDLQPEQFEGDQSIIRFLGEIIYKGYTFKGDWDAPLTFIYLTESGFVHLHGKGTVEKDGIRIADLR